MLIIASILFVALFVIWTSGNLEAVIQWFKRKIEELLYWLKRKR